MRIVRITQAHLQHLALNLGLETDADQLLLDLITLRYTYNHVVNQRAVQTVHRTVARLIRRTRNQHGGFLLVRVGVLVRADRYGNVRVNLLTQLTKRPFHAYRIVGSNRNGYTGRQVYR